MKSLMILIATLALTLVGVHAQAACESNQRISDADSDCLESEQWHSYIGSQRRDHYKARNLCHDLGKMVAKADIKNGADQTRTFNYGFTGWREGHATSPRSVQSVTCCTDLSTLCNRADLVNAAKCEDRWEESSADSYCVDEHFTPHPDDSECQVDTRCQKLDGTYRETSARVHYHQVYRLSNCDGQLRTVS